MAGVAKSWHCQRCRGGIRDPEKDLRSCSCCARQVCAKCRCLDAESESYFCLECAQPRRTKLRAARQERAHVLRALLFLGIIGIGLIVMVLSLAVEGAAIAALGILGVAFHMIGYPACPRCGGRAARLRKKRGLQQYRCTLCGYAWGT